MIDKLRDWKLQIQYIQWQNTESFYHFWQAITLWWIQRPRKIPCANSSRYCSESCAYMGPPLPETEYDGIPF